MTFIIKTQQNQIILNYRFPGLIAEKPISGALVLTSLFLKFVVDLYILLMLYILCIFIKNNNGKLKHIKARLDATNYVLHYRRTI